MKLGSKNTAYTTQMSGKVGKHFDNPKKMLTMAYECPYINLSCFNLKINFRFKNVSSQVCPTTFRP